MTQSILAATQTAQASTRQITLETQNLIKSYGGRRVVNEVSVTVQPGEIVGLLGPNGAGKTTTFNMIVGIVKPDSGHILLNGKDLSRMPLYKRARAGLGYLTQQESVFKKLTVEENILAILQTTRLSRQEQRARLELLLDELKIGHLAHNMAWTLSGGEKRRTEIARALAIEPRFMLLDEPFSGVDPVSVEDLQAIIHQMAERGLGILITDHNVRETLSVTDRSYIIHEGNILHHGNADALVNNEQVRAVYLGETFYMQTNDTVRMREARKKAQRDGVEATDRDDSDPDR